MDYVLVLREHWVPALLLGVVVFGVFLGWALLGAPVYESEATLQLEERDAERTVLEELSSIEKPSSVETEMEVMRSFSVALGAATDEQDPLTSLCWEKNAYRPLASVLRRFGRLGDPCTLKAFTEAKPTANRDLELRFDDGGIGITVEDIKTEEEAVVPSFQAGTPFEAFGHRFRVLIQGGSPAGKTFHLSLRTPTEAARWVQGVASVGLVGERTGIVSVRAEAEAPVVAQSVANAVARSYLSWRQRQRIEDLEATRQFLEEQIEQGGTRLKEAEDRRDAYMAEKNAYQLRARAASINRDQSEATVQLAEFKRQHEEAARELERWKAADTFEERLNLLVAARPDALTQQLAGAYSEQRRQLEVISSELSGEVPRVKTATIQLAATRRQLEERLELLARSAVERLEGDLVRIQARLQETERTLEDFKRHVAEYPEVERHLAQLERAVEARRTSLERLHERMVEVQISQASTKPPVTLVDEAQLPLGRKAPNVGYMLVLGALFGLLGAVAVAFLLDAVDHKVRTPEELEEELGVTTYAAIPSFSSVRRKDRESIRGPLVALDAPRSVITEAYRSLRANIRFATKDKHIQALAITSALAGEGKTVTTLNLAIVLAEGGASVIVLDADMRRSTVHEYMEVERVPGLTEVLSGEMAWRDAVKQSKAPGVDLLTAGRHHDRPHTLLDSEQFQSLLGELRKHYEYVLVDMPPVLAVSDAAPFFARLDGVLMLARSGYCPVGVYQGAVEQVERLGGRVVGTIFNGFDSRRSRRRYGYGYGYRGYYGYRAYYSKKS